MHAKLALVVLSSLAIFVTATPLESRDLVKCASGQTLQCCQLNPRDGSNGLIGTRCFKTSSKADADELCDDDFDAACCPDKQADPKNKTGCTQLKA